MRGIFIAAVALVAYVFAGYPVLIAGLARVRRRNVAASSGSELPFVSIVISAYNEADVIAAKLTNCSELDYPPDRCEVIVVADGSTDGTERAAKRDGVRVLFAPERAGKAAAMARGATVARGDVIVFSDANNLYTPNTLRALVTPFADSSVGVVSGRKEIDSTSGRSLDRSEGLYWRYESRIREWETQFGSTTGVVGEVLAVRRETYGPLSPGTINDDLVLALEAALRGWRIAYVSEARSIERASASLGAESERRARIVGGRLQALTRLLPRLARRRPVYAWQVISHKALRPVVPFALAAAFLSSAAAAPRASWARRALGIQLAFYLTALGGRAAARRGRPALLLYVPYYFCRMNLATLSGIAQYFSRRDLTRWRRVERG